MTVKLDTATKIGKRLRLINPIGFCVNLNKFGTFDATHVFSNIAMYLQRGVLLDIKSWTKGSKSRLLKHKPMISLCHLNDPLFFICQKMTFSLV